MSGGTWCPSAPHQGCPLSSHGESAVQLLFSAAVVLPLWLVNSLWTLEDHENILLIIRISLEIWTSMKDSCLNFITIVTHWWWSTLALSARFPVRMWYSTVTKNAPVGRLRGSVDKKSRHYWMAELVQWLNDVRSDTSAILLALSSQSEDDCHQSSHHIYFQDFSYVFDTEREYKQEEQQAEGEKEADCT